MRKEVFRYLETELRDYPTTRQKYIETVADICTPSGQVDGAMAPLPRDQKEASHWRDGTGRKAERLMGLSHTGKIIKIIERVVMTQPNLVAFCEARYWGEYGVPSWMSMEEHLGISASTLRRVRGRIIHRMSQELGVMW